MAALAEETLANTIWEINQLNQIIKQKSMCVSMEISSGLMTKPNQCTE